MRNCAVSTALVSRPEGALMKLLCTIVNGVSDTHFHTRLRYILLTVLAVPAVVYMGIFTVAAQEVIAEPIEQESEHNNLVRIFGGDAVVDYGESLNDAVVIGGNAVVNGSVNQDLVVIGGNLELGSHVDGDVVVIGGKAVFKDGASVKGDLVTIGVENVYIQKVAVSGDKVIIAPWANGVTDRLMKYVKNCILKGRFFAFSEPWSMVVLGGIIILMLLLAVIFPNALAKSVLVMEQRIFSALLIGILVPVIIGPVFIALAITVIGIPAIPALLLTLKGATLVGIFAICAHVGKQIVHIFSASAKLPLIGSALIGCVILSAVMTLPYIGGFISIAISSIGVGAAIIAIYEIIRNSCPKCATASASAIAQTVNENPVKDDVVDNKNNMTSVIEAAATPLSSSVQGTESLRHGATFFQRLGAATIDCILVMIIIGIVCEPFTSIGSDPDMCGSVKFMLLLVYLVSMWAWKQTTIGMIIFGLKIYRQDLRPVNFGVALIRALALILSIVPLGLGFLWIIWDEQHQGWHDKIAGTVICKVPEKMSLF